MPTDKQISTHTPICIHAYVISVNSPEGIWSKLACNIVVIVLLLMAIVVLIDVSTPSNSTEHRHINTQKHTHSYTHTHIQTQVYNCIDVPFILAKITYYYNGRLEARKFVWL